MISVFYKDGLDKIVNLLAAHGVTIYSTGGTLEFIESLGHKAVSVESLTSYPSILGGRVKTLHPKVFGGILARRENPQDLKQLEEYQIPEMDLVIVDLYPFEETVKSGADYQSIIEKIDIGGISLIRAAAKNHKDVVIVPSREDYAALLEVLEKQDCSTTLEDRKQFAAKAFRTSSNYDAHIFNFFNESASLDNLRVSEDTCRTLRYGENPHQQAAFYGNTEELFTQLNGKEISYNNLLDIDAGVNLIAEFDRPAFAILKHNNACGAAVRDSLKEAWEAALSADPVSAFGGVLVCNRPIDKSTAEEIDKLFFEVLIAPEFHPEALEVLKSKKNRILLQQKTYTPSKKIMRSLLNGVAVQDRDSIVGGRDTELQTVTRTPIAQEKIADLIFANTLVKHSKSNAIVLAKNGMMISSGIGQTSRVDALKQAIAKAHAFGFDLKGAVLASDAYFPFADCVEIAHKEGIDTFIQPGGSIRDKDSIAYCDEHSLSMAFTGARHFKH